MKIYSKRGSWRVEDSTGEIYKFIKEEEALAFAGLEVPAEETLDAEEEIEAEDSEEETDTDEQEIVCDGESDGEEEV